MIKSFTQKNMFHIPSSIHVDANMHPKIYEHILDFALIFDKTSLYAFSGILFEANNKTINIEDFYRLLTPAENSPFILSAPSDWYNRERRIERLNETVVGWHQFDDWITMGKGYTRDAIVYANDSEIIREEAWDATKIYHETLLSVLDKDIHAENENDVRKNQRTIWRAYKTAYNLLEEDLNKYDHIMNNTNDKLKAEREFAGNLPVTFCHNVRHTKNYIDYKEDPLALIFFEHFTKPRIVSEINLTNWAKTNFELFIPGDWHKLLCEGQGVLSTNDILTKKYIYSKESQIASSLLNEFEKYDISNEIETEDKIKIIKDFRSRSGPKMVRKILQKNFNKVIKDDSSDSIKLAWEETVQDLANLAKRKEFYSNFLQKSLLACFLYAGPLSGWLGNIIGSGTASNIIDFVAAASTVEAVFLNKESLTRKWAERITKSSEKDVVFMISKLLSSAQPNLVLPSQEIINFNKKW